MLEVGKYKRTYTPFWVNNFLQISGKLTAPINYYRAAMQLEPSKPPKSKIKPPTLLVWGTEDKALGKEMAEMSGDYCEDFTLRWVPGACHFVQQEEPKAVNKHMREFLEETRW